MASSTFAKAQIMHFNTITYGKFLGVLIGHAVAPVDTFSPGLSGASQKRPAHATEYRCRQSSSLRLSLSRRLDLRPNCIVLFRRSGFPRTWSGSLRLETGWLGISNSSAWLGGNKELWIN